MAVQLAPSRPKPAPVVATPKAEPKVEQKELSWDFGPKELPNVNVAIAAAIAKNSVRTETKPVAKPPVKVKPVRTENLHSHQCARCGNIFSHDNTNHGNAQAHMCPNCGYGPNYRIIGR